MGYVYRKSHSVKTHRRKTKSGKSVIVRSSWKKSTSYNRKSR